MISYDVDLGHAEGFHGLLFKLRDLERQLIEENSAATTL